ncbi:unnamed protein product [Penicillium pancosmium]
MGRPSANEFRTWWQNCSQPPESTPNALDFPCWNHSPPAHCGPPRSAGVDPLALANLNLPISPPLNPTFTSCCRVRYSRSGLRSYVLRTFACPLPSISVTTYLPSTQYSTDTSVIMQMITHGHIPPFHQFYQYIVTPAVLPRLDNMDRLLPSIQMRGYAPGNHRLSMSINVYQRLRPEGPSHDCRVAQS